MARKRKSPTAEGAEEPEFDTAQPDESEYEPESESLLQDPDNQQPQEEENQGDGVAEMEENQNPEGDENNDEEMNQKPAEDDAVLGNGDAAEGENNNGENQGEGQVQGEGEGQGENQGEGEGQVQGESQGEGEGQVQGDDEDEGELEEETIEKLLEPFSKDQVTILLKEAAEKHPDVIESVQKLANVDPAHRKIFVHGLGWEGNRESIVSEFGKYGEIDECKVVIDQTTGKSKGYGFILFKHRDGARKALRKPQKSLWGRSIWCQLASAGPIQAPPPNKAAATPATPMSEYTRRKIFISNVSADVDVPKLIEFFSEFGEIEEGPLGLDKTTGKPKGFCLFVYKNVTSAQKALKEPHKEFDGTILHCQKAIDGPKVGKGYDNYSHYRAPPPPIWQAPQQWAPPPRQQYHHQDNYHHAPKRGRFGGGRGGGRRGGGNSKGRGGGHGNSSGGGGGLNHGVTPAAIGQAVAALMATQGSGAFLGGAPSGYGGAPSGYGGQPGMQGGYGGPPQMGGGGVRPPPQGGAPPYMG